MVARTEADQAAQDVHPLQPVERLQRYRLPAGLAACCDGRLIVRQGRVPELSSQRRRLGPYAIDPGGSRCAPVGVHHLEQALHHFRTYHAIKEAGGEESLPPEEVLRWTLSNSRLPEFTFLDFSVRDGALCGVAQSGYEQGKAAAEMATNILDGEKPADIPITSPEKGNPIVNQGRGDKLNIVIPEDLLDEVEIVGR